jgi:CRP/FNR family transcriptional regulator, nitrogen oxide reductase regulator
MRAPIDEILQRSPVLRRLAPEDRQRVGQVALVRSFDKGQTLFSEGDDPDCLFIVADGRVKVFKTTARGTDVILAIFGPGDPVGAVAIYEATPYPASAMAIEPTTCLLVPRQAFFSLLETYPTMVRALLSGLSQRLVELTNRLMELSGGHIEPRFARFFLKLAGDIGKRRPDGTFIPMALSRQELADMTGTTIETAIRIMSRWGKQDIVRTEKDGFLVIDRSALASIALS